MLNENATFFWERVKQLIKQQNTTQEWVATQCDVSLGMIKSWIFNNRLPDAAQAVRMAKALNTTVEYLVTGQEKDLYKGRFEKLVQDMQSVIDKA